VSERDVSYTVFAFLLFLLSPCLLVSRAPVHALSYMRYFTCGFSDSMNPLTIFYVGYFALLFSAPLLQGPRRGGKPI
jgi:hypothetical protein